ncbi:Subtilisin-like protease SBT1.6 [Forsythia ovata]|uniref:Subtilisin-like protease SBT1.6 n=1 Tax=Forsythia ovata TaxID=205694 RepID=A0ABD1WFY8_9LAMI
MSGGDEEAQIDRLLIDLLVNIFALFTRFENLAHEPTSILHVYDTVFHGFSASLTPSQAASILKHPSILTVFEDRRRHLHTTRSPQFLGLRNQRGLWSESDYGSDVIIGLFDTGIWPEHRSFSDLNLGHVPKRWKGVCNTGVKFTAKNCNRKIIGARFFSKGHE